MKHHILKSKIHRCRVTDKNINYEGSITVDRELMDAAGLLPYEMVDVLDINNGSRFSTYVIEGKPGGGDIILNGAAARLVEKDDLVIIVASTILETEEAIIFHPKIVHVDEKTNRIKKS
jgi:aspartate 1-decarboxylase